MNAQQAQLTLATLSDLNRHFVSSSKTYPSSVQTDLSISLMINIGYVLEWHLKRQSRLSQADAVAWRRSLSASQWT